MKKLRKNFQSEKAMMNFVERNKKISKENMTL